jgi:hypothetical protein
MKYSLTGIFLLFILGICMLSSCEEIKKSNNLPKGEGINFTIPDQGEGISFTLPDQWEIKKIDSTEADFFFMSINKVGFGASANAFIEWNKGEIALDTVMNITQQGYFEHKVFVEGGIKFSVPKMESYGTHNALTSEFNFEYKKQIRIGKIHCFYLKDCNKTVMIAYELLAEDSAKQQDDFKMIEESFGCKKEAAKK